MANANQAACKYALFKEGHTLAAVEEKKNVRHTNKDRHAVPEGTNYLHTAAVGGVRKAPAQTNREGSQGVRSRRRGGGGKMVKH